MCGGRGIRLRPLTDDAEKPLVGVAGAPLVERVVEALADSPVSAIFAACSPQTPETAAFLRKNHPSVTVLDTPGEGYVPDLDAALSTVGRPALTVAADVPLLSSSAVAAVCERWTGGSLAVCLPVAEKRALGVSVDTSFDHEGSAVTPAGVNVVADGPDEILVVTDRALAVNVNRPADLAVAEALLRA
ncbi:NTP transferase domain-containing protein [Haloferacaceae archaeon DSL9]